jgi:hypothetical protein
MTVEHLYAERRSIQGPQVLRFLVKWLARRLLLRLNNMLLAGFSLGLDCGHLLLPKSSVFRTPRPTISHHVDSRVWGPPRRGFPNTGKTMLSVAGSLGSGRHHIAYRSSCVRDGARPSGRRRAKTARLEARFRFCGKGYDFVGNL